MPSFDLENTLSAIGDRVSGVVSRGIGFFAAQTPAKIITLLVILIALYAVIKIVEKPIKWAIAVLLILLAVSVATSLT